MNSAPGYRWQCHRCRFINPPEDACCGRCGFKAVATGYEIQGQEKAAPNSLLVAAGAVLEGLARLIHILAGCLFLSVAVWAVLVAPVFNPWVFWGALVLGVFALLVGIRGSRKAVLMVFACAWF